MDESQRPLPSIPIPPAQRWREVRLLYLPRIVFAVGVAVAAWMWNRWITPSTLVAEAEVTQAEVRSPQDGVIVDMTAVEFQMVEANAVVGFVAPVGARAIQTTLDLIRSEVDMLATSMSGVADRQRVALDFERLQVEWMGARVELASLRGKLRQAESDLQRMTPLHRAGVVSDDEFSLVKSTHEALVEQVGEQDGLVKRLEPLFNSSLVANSQQVLLATESPLSDAIKLAEVKLKLAEEQLKPLPLVAPIRGVISQRLRRSGEAVVAGEPILRVTLPSPEKLTGFLRQPLPMEPKVGMPVEILTRTSKRQSAASTILQVGSAMEPISPSLISALRLPPTPLPEPGLRIQIAIPKGLAIRPGEFVDVVIP